MRKKKHKPQPFYRDEFRHHVIKRVLTGQLTRAKATKEYNIGSINMISNWMRILGYINSTPLPLKNNPLPNPATEKPEDSPDLKQQLKEYQQLLHQEQLRSEFYQLIIDTAERELGVMIRKKSDAK